MKKQDFNRGWRVQKEGESVIKEVNLPHDAMLYETRSPKEKSGSGGAFFPGGKYFYHKDWEVSEDLCHKTVILEFEGVYQKTQVLLNGETVARWPYGYSNFFVDVTGLLHPGANALTVIADNSEVPNSRWYSGSGIYREVQCYVGNREYIAPEGIRVAVLDPQKVHIQVTGQIAPDTCVEIQIISQEGTTVATGLGQDITLFLPDAKPWNAENPYLYTCTALLRKNGETLDEASVKFGMRTLHWGGQGLLINGQQTLLRGACIHHDNGVLGACCFRDAEYRKVRILKEAGFNAIRSAHNPISKAMLDACDELGMYVMDETFDMWLVHKNPYDYAGETFRTWWQKDTEAMIAKDFNHPSVILYSVGNEISELGREDGQSLARKMVAFCHEKDPFRPVTAGINLVLAQLAAMRGSTAGFSTAEGEVKDDTASAPTSEFFNKMMDHLGGRMDKAASGSRANKIARVMREIFDIPGYNYATSRYQLDGREAPNQATVGSETMPHSLYDNWQLVKKIPTLVGDFMWTGWDHLGESGIGTVRYLDRKTKKDIDPGLIITSGAGVIDICGKKRPEVGWNRSIWGLDEDPTLSVSPYTHTTHFASKRMWRKRDTIASWSWENCEGNKADVVVYAASPYVTLACNGKVLGRKKTRKNVAIFPGVAYHPGVLEAIALDEQFQEVSRTHLTSAEGKTSIRLTPETTSMIANGQDLCFLNIELVGENGIPKASVDQPIHVEVTGAGILQGFGSARPNMAQSFVDNTHTTYYGKTLAVIRAGYTHGTIHVTVSAQGLPSESLELTVVSSDTTQKK